MHQVDLNMRRQKQQSKFHTSSRFCQETFPDDEWMFISFSQNASCAPPAVCPNYPQMWQLEEIWEEAAGRGGTFPPRTHHSELLEVFPELCLATVMRNPTNKNFIGFIVIAPGSFLLNQGEENSVRKTIRLAASIILHWTMNNGLWQAQGESSSLEVSQPWKGSTFRAQRFSIPCSSEDQGLYSEAIDSFYTEIWWSCRAWSGLERHQPCQCPSRHRSRIRTTPLKAPLRA